MRNIIKGSLMASFLLLLSPFSFSVSVDISELEQAAIKSEIYKHPTWAALLHTIDGLTQIQDPSFVLSKDNFSLQNELIATIRLLESNSKASCQFPARRQFILDTLNITSSTISKPVCKDYLIFKKKAPADYVSLIYATENISQPSSMMGHIMLKISGKNDKGLDVEHGVSYFTELNSFNVPVIIWESLVTGKNGYFQLSPFQEALNHYLNVEQRNVWEYKIDIAKNKKEVFHDHLWELKKTKLKYFFNSYNCATFTKMLLRVGNSNKVNIDSSWLSPIDIVKSSHQSKVISSSKLIPSDKWQLRMLSNTVNVETKNNILNIINSNGDHFTTPESPEDTYLTSVLGKTYNQYQFKKGAYDLERWRSIDATIEKIAPQGSQEFLLDLSQYKSPLKTPNDSQVSIGYRNLNDKNLLNIRLLPASHGIEDDNRQFFSENELKLMEISLLAQPETGDIKLDSWTLYSAKSYIPWNQFTGGTSGHFSIGAEQQSNDDLQSTLAGNIYGGVGYTLPVTKDFNIYGMMNIGLAISSIGGYFYTEPEVGLYLYEIFDMKTFFSFKKIYNQQKSKYEQNLISINHSAFILNQFSILAEYKHRWNKEKTNTQYGIHLKYQY